jgi:hypothetical protein
MIRQEVFPAIGKIAKRLGLKSPFDANAPVSIMCDLKPHKVSAGE